MSQRSSQSDRDEPTGSDEGCCAPVTRPLSESALADDVQVLSALGNDTRYEALRRIAGSSDGVCVCELEPDLGVSQGAISQALSRLYTADLVSRRKEGRWRYYSATPRAEAILDTLDETREPNDDTRGDSDA